MRSGSRLVSLNFASVAASSADASTACADECGAKAVPYLEQAADDRSDDRADGKYRGRLGQRPGPGDRLVDVADDRPRHDHHCAASDGLDNAFDDQRKDRRREGARDAGSDVEAETRGQHAMPAEAIGQGARDQLHRAEGRDPRGERELHTVVIETPNVFVSPGSDAR